MDLSKYDHKIFSSDIPEFESVALDVFHFQYKNNQVYRDYIDVLHRNPSDIEAVRQIPFLPIRFFKSHAIQTTTYQPALIFESSGTTGSINSRHRVKDAAIYEKSFTRGFELEYGNIQEWCILGLLPSYIERGNSSLVYMVDRLISKTNDPRSGFYLSEYEKLSATLKTLEEAKQKTILVGVTFALLDFAERFPMPLKHAIIIETGGMKGRRKEMIRAEVHEVLKTAFDLPQIHSEYGMTELLSQAYSKGNGIFKCPPWMKVMVRDDEDPFSITATPQKAGAINIIDLANIYSCSFIATDDAGRLYDDGSFEVLGRIDNSDIRGCSLMTI